jgi:tetratricopeptide (TPR) repeat protein
MGIAEEKPSWTERLTAPLRKNPFARVRGDADAVSATSPTGGMPGASDTPDLYVGMAQVSHRDGNIAQARQQYQRALTLDPHHLEALLGAARMEDRDGDIDVALSLYQRAVAAHPQCAAAHNDLALCLARRGDLAAADRALDGAIALDPAKQLYRNNKAKVLVELNQLDSACENLAAVHPPAIAHYNMGVLLSQRGRNGEADEQFARSLAIDPQLQAASVMLTRRTPSMDAVQHSIVSQAPADAGQQLAAREDILPTPEIVATAPWQPPTEISVAPTGPTGSPIVMESTSDQSPLLILPPVN